MYKDMAFGGEETPFFLLLLILFNSLKVILDILMVNTNMSGLMSFLVSTFLFAALAIIVGVVAFRCYLRRRHGSSRCRAHRRQSYY